ncbi:MAG: GTPase Era [Candidatus Omnitrophota bacterium]
MKEESRQLRCGFVAVVGRPNTGKSTLVNNILGKKVAIVSSVPQTTRNKIRGIYNEKRGQIIFIDTPGLHLAADQLGKYMNATSAGVIEEAEVIIHLADTRRQVGREEEFIVARLKRLNKPIILGLNKIDLGGKFLSQYIELWEKALNKPVQELTGRLTCVPLSGLTGKNLDALLDEIFRHLPQGEALYPVDMSTDVPQNLAIAEIIREKFLNLMREEVPFSLAVKVEEVVPRTNKLTYIRAKIIVERESQKEIVIGRHAEVLKQAGSLAREEIERLLNTKVFLETQVVSEKKWRDDPQVLRELGYVY